MDKWTFQVLNSLYKKPLTSLPLWSKIFTILVSYVQFFQLFLALCVRPGIAEYKVCRSSSKLQEPVGKAQNELPIYSLSEEYKSIILSCTLYIASY